MVNAADSKVYSYHFNAIGSTVAITDSTQAVVSKYAYSPWGVTTASETGGFTQPFRYVGQAGVMQEPTGNLYYMRARYYDPAVGRFISEDPIGFSGKDLNLHAYVKGNPINYIDPHGTVIPFILAVGASEVIIEVAEIALAAYTAYTVSNNIEKMIIYYQSNRTPAIGQPNSSEVFTNGNDNTERFYGEDGRASVDIDYGHDHGSGDPHYHEWDWTNKKPRGGAISLPITANSPNK